MRRNDFFKYLLLGGEGSASRSELESETLPYTFNSNSYKLRNYRIYGNTVNGESVGDLVTEGEHAGEYCVPITINGTLINIFTQNQLIKIVKKADYIDYQKQKMYRISKNLWNEQVEQGSVDTAGNFSLSDTRLRSGYIDVESGKTYTLSSNLKIRLIYSYNENYEKVERILDAYKGTFNHTFIVPDGAAKIIVTLMSARNSEDTITTEDFIWGQLEEGGEVTSYESYFKTNEFDIIVPALPTVLGENEISVNTAVQPSKVYLQGKISEIETVSVQALQANMQSLQPLSFDDEDLELDVMPTDNNLQLDVKPIEKPVLNLNDVSEIENAEIERGVESAE